MSEHYTVDCHAHIIDPSRFPIGSGPGYQPKAHETGTREAFCAVLNAHRVNYGLLVQPSCYWFDNSALLDAMAVYAGRFKAIAVVDPESSDRFLAKLAQLGVVGVRFNMAYDRHAFDRPQGRRLLDRLKELGWFVQVFARSDLWVDLARILRQSGSKILIDHFGMPDLAKDVRQPGFGAVLELGREGRAVVKLSAPFRISKTDDFADLDPYAEALLDAFGATRCIWGSDWPFINLAKPPQYGAVLKVLERWVPNLSDRERIFGDNAAYMFGFKEKHQDK